MRFQLLSIVLLLVCTTGRSQAQKMVQPVSPHHDPTLRFTENAGQWQNNILFRAQLDGGALFIENNNLTFHFYDKVKFRALHHGGILKGRYKDLNIRGHAWKVHFEGANPNPRVEKGRPGSDYENFFIGSDESRWRGRVQNYQQVWLRDLYPDIDYEIISASRAVKYNFHAKPGSATDKIRLRYEGIGRMKLKDGVLYLKPEIGEVTEQKPYAWQKINGQIREVVCHYTLKNNVLGFEFPNGYDKTVELVIDPLLVFAAQSGSTADNFGMTATYDPQGNLYSGGTVFNVGYPVTLGAYSNSFGSAVGQGNTDVVITKYNPSGTGLIYSTYFGGNGTEIITSLVIDYSGNLCFYGATGSTNFPITNGAYDNSFNGGAYLSFVFNGTTFNNGTDIFVGKFNSTGNTLLGCTYLGGSGNDGVNHVNTLNPLPPPNPPILEYLPDSLQYNYGDQYRGEIQVDPANNIYIASSTRSSNFPTVNAFDATLGGQQDAIVAKFNSNLTSLLYASYIGGSKNDAGYGIFVKNNLEVYVTGGTCSNNFPYASGGYQSVYQGGKADGYILRISPTGTVMSGTYFGTPNYDQSYFVQVDKYNEVYVFGQSLGNMPVLAASNETVVYSNPGRHQFISRFNPALTSLTLSTVFGNYTNDVDVSPSAFSIDKCNTIYVGAWGGDVIYQTNPMSGMPLLNATQSTTDGFDFYFMALDSNATQLLYGSYFGGNISDEHVDGGTSRFDPMGRIYQSVCAGCGGNDDFPVTPGAWPNTPGNPNHAFNCNNGVIKLDFQINITISTISTNTLAGCAPFTASLSNATPSANTTYTWYSNSVPVSNGLSFSATYTAAGIYTLALVSFNSASCNRKDSAITYVTVYGSPTVNFTPSVVPCTNVLSTTNQSTGNFGPDPFTWNFGNGATSTLSAPGHTYVNNGNYNITLTAKDVNGCISTLTKSVSVFLFTPATANATICNGSAVTLTASGGTSYSWTPSTGLNNPGGANPVANPTVTTLYSVSIVHNGSTPPCQATLTSEVLVNPTPTTNFNFTVNPCGGGAYFEDLSQDDIVSWNWRFSPTATSFSQNPYYFYYTGGNYTITLVTSNIYNCRDTLSKPLSILTPPPVSVSAATAVCRLSSVPLSASGGTTYSWTPPETLDNASIATPSATPLVDTQYSVVITTTATANGLPCSFLLITFVDVDVLSSGQVTAVANPTLITTGETSTLIYIGDPGALVTWLPPGSTSPGSGYSVTAAPDRPTTYTAVATRGACRENPEVHVDAYSAGCIDKDAYVPNTFTPNGDGQNDIFIPRGLKIDQIYFAVYNRWGELVFDTSDKTKGWDGTYKGKPLDVGVFGWYLKVKCLNGEEAFRKGNVTLIR